MDNKKISVEQSVLWRNLALVLFLLVATYSAWAVADTYARRANFGSLRSFAVTGEGKVVAVPDVAEFTAGVTTEGGSDLVAIQAENTRKMNAVVSFLKENGVEEKDVKTTNYNVSPRYQYSSCGGVGICPPPEIVGYTVSQSVLVKVRDFKKAGDLLSGVVGKGANSVSQLSFSIDDRTALENQAREEAIRKAREKVPAIVKAGGFSLGKLISVDETYYPGPVYYGKDVALGMGGAERSVPPVVEPGSQEITVNVMLRYEIK